MKKIFLAILLLTALLVSACGSSTSNTPNAQTNPNNGELPQVTKLVLGTLKLDGTENAVTPEQAKDLLPLWQVYVSLLDSDTAAQEEIDALINQIGETMTPEQNQAINDMNLSQQDMFSVMQEQGITSGNRSQNSSGTRSGNSSGNSGGFGPPGGGDGFAPPDGGGGGNFGGEGFSPDQIATAQAARQAGGNGFGGFNRTPNALIEQVITYLTKIAGS